MKRSRSQRAGRKPRFDHRRRQLYLESLAHDGIVGNAMKAAGVRSRTTLKNAREKINGFAEAEDEALQSAADRVEAIVSTRSEFGHRVPILGPDGTPFLEPQTGKLKTTFVPPSEKLLMARLKALKPEKYGTHRHNLKTENSGVLVIPQFESEEAFVEMLEKVRLEAMAESAALERGLI